MTDRAYMIGKALSAALVLGLSGGVVRAQDAGEGSEIIVEAPRSAPLPMERSPYTGAAIVTSTVRIPVFYGDLDLAKPGDGERLMTRVRRVAQDVCKQLDILQPLNPDTTCVNKAIASGTAAAKAAIEKAQERR